jgi:hypothetical protein
MRNLKILGLALVAMFSVSAVGATVASANDFTAEENTVTLTGKKEAGTTDLLTTTAGTVNCSEPTYHATATTGSTAITVTPDYATDGTCTAFGLPATIDMNSCRYIFRVNAGVTTHGSVDIECNPGDEITITQPPTDKCVVHVPAQTGLTEITYTNIGAGATREVTLDVNLKNIKYTHTKGSGLAACTAGSATNGSLTSKATVKADKVGTSTQVGIFMSNV